jgi:hypothetical protein
MEGDPVMACVMALGQFWDAIRFELFCCPI